MVALPKGNTRIPPKQTISARIWGYQSLLYTPNMISHRERQRERQRDRDRETETERERETHTDTERETEAEI